MSDLVESRDEYIEVGINELVEKENVYMTVRGHSLPIKIVSNTNTSITFENAYNEIVEHDKHFMIGSKVRFYKKKEINGNSTKPVYTDNWINAKEMHEKNPDSFEIPSKEELDNLKEGDLVKICNGCERFFVKVSKILSDGNMNGIVDNHLIFETEYGFRDSVQFHRDNIYTIYL